MKVNIYVTLQILAIAALCMLLGNLTFSTFKALNSENNLVFQNLKDH